MSFLISYSAGRVDNTQFARIGKREVPSPLVVSKNESSLYVGELFNARPEDFFSSGWEANPNVLNDSFCSALSAVHFDKAGCVFATGITSLEPLYYYWNGEKFAVSDAFWDLVEWIDPSYADLDQEAIEEMIAVGGAVFGYRTPIRHLYWVPGNRMGKFEADSRTFAIEEYSPYAHSCEVDDLDVAVDNMDRILNDAARWLIEAHPGKTFGVGLSGGLDSRVMLHYLKRNGANVACFNTCTKRPHHVLVANSVKKARALATTAGVDLAEIEWSATDLRRKIELKLEHEPLGPAGSCCDIYKYEEKSMPAFDVLVTGGSGIGPFLVGCTIPKDSAALSAEEVASRIYNLVVAAVLPLSIDRWVLKAWLDNRRGRRAHQEGDGTGAWNAVVPLEAYERLRADSRQFVDRRLEQGRMPGDIFFEIRAGFLSVLNRTGAYESRLGQCRSYSYNAPFLVKEALRWSIDVIEDRRVIKALIERKIPEFASIGEEEFGGATTKESRFTRLTSRIDYLFRGSGILASEWFAKNRVVKREFYRDMESGASWFYDMFPVRDRTEELWSLSPSRKNSIWDMKRLIDCIEQRSYLSFQAKGKNV